MAKRKPRTKRKPATGEASPTRNDSETKASSAELANIKPADVQKRLKAEDDAQILKERREAEGGSIEKTEEKPTTEDRTTQDNAGQSNTNRGKAICDKTDNQGAENDTNNGAKCDKKTNEGAICDKKEGSVTPSVAVDGGEPATRTRRDRGRRWEQVRREARARGKNRGQAIAHANAVCAEEFPEFAADYPIPEPEPEATPAPEIAAEPDTGRVLGLGDIPGDWPALPSNASLAAEVQWVQASRVDVVEILPGGGARVDLSHADHPAPSKAALSWLETSILFPSKFADVSVKATQGQADEREHVRRERRAIEDVRALLAEMVEAEKE
jgi:hypothetical protein